jgi:hypothetical protein
MFVTGYIGSSGTWNKLQLQAFLHMAEDKNLFYSLLQILLFSATNINLHIRRVLM